MKRLKSVLSRWVSRFFVWALRSQAEEDDRIRIEPMPPVGGEGGIPAEIGRFEAVATATAYIARHTVWTMVEKRALSPEDLVRIRELSRADNAHCEDAARRLAVEGWIDFILRVHDEGEGEGHRLQ